MNNREGFAGCVVLCCLSIAEQDRSRRPLVAFKAMECRVKKLFAELIAGVMSLSLCSDRVSPLIKATEYSFPTKYRITWKSQDFTAAM